MKEFFQYAVPALIPVLMYAVKVWYKSKEKKTAQEIIDIAVKESPTLVEKLVEVYTKKKVIKNAPQGQHKTTEEKRD